MRAKLLAALLLGAVVIWVSQRSGQPPQPEVPGSAKAVHTPRVSEAPSTATAIEPVSESAKPGTTTASELPRANVVRQEARQDPHAVPPSLLEYASRTAARIAAISAESEATALYDELERCVRLGETATLQAYCLANAKVLSLRHDNLVSRYSELSQSVPAAVLDRVALLDE